MWSRLYRDHLIMPFPSYDTAVNGWAPQVDISWCVGPARDSEFVRFPNRFMTENQAVSYALRKGQAWIDERLRRLHGGGASARDPVIDIIGALKQSPGKASRERLRHAQPPIERRAQKTFTFDQFRSVIAGSGLRISDQTLQKSYAALVKLRKDKHWSWAETIRKVEHSQQNPGAAKSLQRRPRATRIPLSGRDWRRIG